MEMRKQQKLNGPNRVNFQQPNQHETLVATPHNGPVINQRTIEQINTKTNSRIIISPDETWDFHTVKTTLSKLTQFINFHNLEQSEIWANKKQLSISQFARLFNENYGFHLTNEELTALLKVSTKKQSLKPSDFQFLGLWIEKENPFKVPRYSANLSSQTVHIKKTRRIKNTNQTDLNQSYTGNAWNSSTPPEQIRKLSETFKSSFNLGKNFSKDGFREAQQYSKAKVQNKVQSLKKDIKESVLEKKWDFIVMAGEMNQWIDQLKKQIQKQGHQNNAQNFLCFKFKVLNKDPVEIIQLNSDTKESECIPHVVFIKKYQTLKKKMVKEENNKNNLKGTVLMVLEDQDKFSKNVLINRINQRDQQLNFVLLQIMRMKSMFQWQNNILKEANINS